MQKEKKFRQLKGHKLTRTWTGGECGKWYFDGWTEHAYRVVQSHHTHLTRTW